LWAEGDKNLVVVKEAEQIAIIIANDLYKKISRYEGLR
jgi:hypothetical protein